MWGIPAVHDAHVVMIEHEDVRGDTRPHQGRDPTFMVMELGRRRQNKKSPQKHSAREELEEEEEKNTVHVATGLTVNIS